MNPTVTYTKSRLIKELAFMSGIPQVKSRAVLDALGVIIRRETAAGPFILPGLCKFDTVMRKERRLRNPRTGEALIVPAQKALRLTPSKSLRNAAAPRIPAIKAPKVESPNNEATDRQTNAAAAEDEFILPNLIAEEPKAPAPVPEPPEPVPPKAEAPAATEPEFTIAHNGDITFHCTHCGQEIEAPSDMAGTEAECPMCGAPIRVPAPSGQAKVTSSEPTQDVVSTAEAEAIDPSALKNKTIRIDATELGFAEPAPAPQAPKGDTSGMISFFCPGCHQEIEATADMAGTTSECPNCGTQFEVPFFSEKGTIHAKQEELFDPRKVDKQKHKTMRIDLDDF